MKPRGRTLERLEDRYAMDSDPALLELSPVVRGTIERSAADWAAVRDATNGNVVNHFSNDQAGEQRHLWSGTYYGWEGMAEFTTDLPEGTIIESATLRLTIVNKLDTMNRKPLLTAYVSSQDSIGTIVPSEYRNATGEAIGSLGFDDIVIGQEMSMSIDTAAIPTNGNVSISLRTSDLIAGQEPVSDHNSVSAFYWSGVRLDVRYRMADMAATGAAIDAVMTEIGNDVDTALQPADTTTVEAVTNSPSAEEWNYLSQSFESAFEREKEDAEFREAYRYNNVKVAAVSLAALEPMRTAAQQSFANADANHTRAVHAYNNAEAQWKPVRAQYVAVEVQERELIRIALLGNSKAYRARTGKDLTNFRNRVFYPVRTQEMALATAMDTARTTMNNAGIAKAHAQATLNAVTEVSNNARAFAMRSHADNTQLPTIPVDGEPSAPTIPPRIMPVLAERNHLMVSIDAAGESTQIGIQGIHNPLSQISVSHAGGALGITRALTFTQDIPSGTYNVILSTREYGLTLGIFPVMWDATTKQVTYNERAFASLATTAPEEPLSNDLQSEFIALGTSLRSDASTAVARTDASFRNASVQRQALQGLTYPTLTNIWGTAEATMMAAFPDIFPTDKAAWVAAKVAASNGTLRGGMVEDRLHSKQSDMRHRLRDALADMENIGLKIIDVSMRAIARIYAGSSQQAEWNAFQQAHAGLLTTPAYRAEVGFLSSCGIFMPSASAFWNESWTQFHAQQDFLVHMHEEERHLIDEILPNLSRNKAITAAKDHAEKQAAADIAAGRHAKTEERYVDDYFKRIAKNSRGSNDERRQAVTERQIRRILGSSNAQTRAFAERIGLREMDIAQAIIEAMDPAVLESVARAHDGEQEDDLTDAMEEMKKKFDDLIAERESQYVSPEDFINRYLTPQGKLRYLHLLETEDELSHYGYDVAANPGFMGSFDEMYQGMFGREAMKLEPVHFKIGVDMNKLLILKPSVTPLSDIVSSVKVTIGTEDPRAALLRRAEEEINRMVLNETLEAIQDIGVTAKRSLVTMRRAAVWTAVTAYNTTNAAGELGEDAVRITATETAALAKLIAHRMKFLIPFISARGATSYEEKHDYLLASGVMEHHPGDGSKNGKLIVLINGHIQDVYDGIDEEIGMEHLEKEFAPKGYEVLQFRVGLAWEMLYRNPNVIKEITQEAIFERLRRQGVFANTSPVIEIVGAGYSWGGGTLSDITNVIDTSEFGSLPISIGLIDAVRAGYDGLSKPVTSRPAADVVFNRYQTNNDFSIEQLILEPFDIDVLPFGFARKMYGVATEGQPAHGSLLLGGNLGDDQKELSEFRDSTINHLTIDDEYLDREKTKLNPILPDLKTFMYTTLQ